MMELNLLDETFDGNQSHNYHLSIQTDMQSLSFCILDTIRNKYIGLRNYQTAEPVNLDISEINSILESDDLLKLSYKKVSNMVINSKNTLVPVSFYDENKSDAIFRLNHAETPQSSILVNKLTDAGICNIFSCDIDFSKTFATVFPNVQPYHYSTPFIENLILESTKWTRPKCYVLIHKYSLAIGIAQQNNLEFFNSFDYRENSDIIYFILSVLEQLKLSTMNTDVFISVESGNQREIIGFLNNYLNLIRLINPNDHFAFSYIFDGIQLTRYANLFNLPLCE